MIFIGKFLSITIAAAFVSLATAYPCLTDNDCLPTQVCYMGPGCFDPCQHFDNTTKGICYVTNHSMTIECFKGYRNIPSTYECEKLSTGCKSHTDCDSEEHCEVETGVCFNPCRRLAERANGYCSVSNHEVSVECLDGYRKGTSGLGCEPIPPPCQSLDDCPPTEFCNIGTGCYDPCQYFDNTTKGICYVSDYTMTIECFKGYRNIPSTYECEKLSTGCKSHTDCDSEEHCEVETGVCFNPCRRLAERANGYCSVSNHEVSVKCLEGYRKIPSRVGCVPMSYACQSLDDCPPTEFCNIGTGCYDPCQYFDNTTKGICYVSNYTLTIECFEGYRNIPSTYECEKLSTGCKSHTDCDSEEHCEVETGVCFNPCRRLAERANGYCSVSNHEVSVKCLEGYRKIPSRVGCVPMSYASNHE